MISQPFLWHEVVQVTFILAVVMSLYGWHAVLEAWFDDVKKDNMPIRLFLAAILTVAAVGVWYFLRVRG
jgi:hypothetical protein